MIEKYIQYVADTETTNLDNDIGDIIELCLHRINDGATKTWCIKAVNIDGINPGALKTNGHKLEDITWKTKEGRARYQEPSIVLKEVELFMLDDNAIADDRILIGQNVIFDYYYMKSMYKKHGTYDTFPFGRQILDTRMIELFQDFAKGKLEDSYSLAALNKRHGIKNEKAHTAEADVIATSTLFKKQCEKYVSSIKG
jgi:DNA polymerase III alpha subunit (gram-positive type)